MREDDDALERACNRIWSEISRLLPLHRRLVALGDRRSEDDARELAWIMRRLGALRRRAARYREVMRDEADARALE